MQTLCSPAVQVQLWSRVALTESKNELCRLWTLKGSGCKPCGQRAQLTLPGGFPRSRGVPKAVSPPASGFTWLHTELKDSKAQLWAGPAVLINVIINEHLSPLTRSAQPSFLSLRQHHLQPHEPGKT